MQFLSNVDVKGKKVFLRADLDVPIVNGKIEDETRLLAAMPSIEYLQKQNAKIVIAGHLGRPEGEAYESRSMNHELSLKSVAQWFVNKLNHNSSFPADAGSSVSRDMIHDSKIGEFEGWQIGENIFLLENLRFNPGEEKNDPEFSKKLAGLADIFVNDAFAMCHRNHASIVGITQFLPHLVGLHLEQELTSLKKATEEPQRPLVVVIGGKKIETKLPLVEKMHRIADYVLVGGKIAEEKEILAKVQQEAAGERKSTIVAADMNPDGLDITEKSAIDFAQIIKTAKTIIWNGSMGLTGETEETEKGTKIVAEAIINSQAYSIIGGGDTTDYLNKLGITDKFSFVSTGGGAMLSFLSGEKLPGIDALS